MGVRQPEATADQARLESFLERWHVALATWRRGDMEAAGAAFRALAAEDPADGPSRTFAARCQQFLESGVPDNWNGVTVFREK
jgi:hypothetical protein